MDIAILLYPNFTALDAIGPAEVLSSMPGARVHFVAETPGLIRNDTGTLTMLVTHGLEDVPKPTIILVPGGPGCVKAMKSGHILNWLSKAQRRTRWITSVGTGSLILGAAGLLNGAHATTHWASRAELAPFGATYVRERYVQHGRIITAAGVSAGIDMTLFLVRDLAGIAMMQAVQLAVEYDPQPLLPMITPPTNTEDLTVDTYQIMDQRMGKPHPLPAQYLMVSSRECA